MGAVARRVIATSLLALAVLSTAARADAQVGTIGALQLPVCTVDGQVPTFSLSTGRYACATPTSLTLPVSVANGGLNKNSATAGDIPCASSSSAYGAIAGSATGKVLISGGATTCGSWSNSPSIDSLTLSNGGAALNVTTGRIASTGGFNAGTSGLVYWNGGTILSSSSSRLKVENNNQDKGFILDPNTVDGTALLLTRAAADSATFAASQFKTTTPLVALGGGAAPTVGTIGGSGPATAAQNSWLKMTASDGSVFWVPVWK